MIERNQVLRELKGTRYLAEAKLRRLLDEFPNPNRYQRHAIADAKKQLQMAEDRLKQESQIVGAD